MTDTSQGKIQGKEVIPADSSASRSLNQEGKINNLKNFRSTRSFRRKGRSKIMKPTKPLSDDGATPSESSTPDIKNQGKKGISQASHHSFDNSVHSQEHLGSSGRKSLQTLMRTTSLRTMRASFKSKKRPSFRCSQVPKVKTVGKPTCSSTIKNSKFTENAGLKTGQTESDRLDMYKVCSYHHCSLHGHSHDLSNPPKRFYMRRKSLKSKKSIKRKNESNSKIALSVTEDSNVDSDSKSLHPPDGEAKASAEKEKDMRMWHLIRRHLQTNHEVYDENLADDSSKLPAPESSGLSSTADQDVKLLAIKFVREAIEKILLPEVPDQSSDDLSITRDTASDQEPLEKNHDETSTSSNDGQNIEKAKREVANESERKAPKHWSNLKKWILLQRFIKEMEKVGKINPRKPRNLQLEPDPEQENVHLRRQIVEERKRGEEWMLDYALQQAISQLAPTQKRKVEMLVKAFETVVPSQEDQHFQFSFPKLKSNDEDDGFVSGENETISKANDDILSCCNPIDNDTQSSDNLIAKTARESDQQTDEFHGGYPKDGTGRAELETQNYISMWHMVSHHVLSGIASKIGSELLDGADDEAEETKPRGSRDQDLSKPRNKGDAGNDDLGYRRNFNRDDAIKLVREAVNEILITQSQDDSVDTKSDQLNRTESSQHDNNLSLSETSLKECELGEEGKETAAADNVIANDDTREVSEAKGKDEVPKSKKWSKLKNLLLLKRSIMAMENARKLKLQQPQHLPLMPNTEPERVDLRHQMMDERKKAEQWMLDYAVQHIVSKLTPARKRRVAMLVEAFEAVVPFPEI